MATCFTSYDISQKPILVLGYVAYFICGFSIAVYEFKVFSSVLGDDLVGPYIVTILLIGAVGLVGVILTFIQRDVFLIILACLTIGLMVFWRLAEGRVYFEVYLLIYALITIVAPFVSCYFTRHRKATPSR